jgi:hypothetical protein
MKEKRRDRRQFSFLPSPFSLHTFKVDSPGVAPRFSACGADVFLLDHEPVSSSGSRPPLRGGARLEPTSDLFATCFRDRFLIPPDDFRNGSAAEVGIEPTPRRSERPILPLDDPAVITNSQQSCGGRNRTCVSWFKAKHRYQQRLPRRNRCLGGRFLDCRRDEKAVRFVT